MKSVTKDEITQLIRLCSHEIGELRNEFNVYAKDDLKRQKDIQVEVMWIEGIICKLKAIKEAIAMSG